MTTPILYIVVPCYNEEAVLGESSKQFLNVLSDMIEKSIISDKSKILFVNDGSKDKTWQIIEELTQNNKHFSGISLSKNRGHQNALLAGLMTAKNYADVTISIDSDLQDDINAVYEMMEKYKNEACEIVFGVRSKREIDTFFKRFSAQSFYKLMKSIGVSIVYNHSDYRLLSKKALEALAEYNEVNIFLRGLVCDLGYKTAEVFYERQERFAGESKYPLRKMLSFAFQGISSFSISPIRLITTLGFIMSILSIFATIYALISLLLGIAMPGWTSLLISIWFIGGIQILSIGLIGEYIGKIYLETKHRPKYIISEKLNLE